MDETTHDQHDNPFHEKNHHEPRNHWRLLNMHWGFWLGIICLTVALLVYIFSVDLALVPRVPQPQHQSMPMPSGR
jgi:hypothetical protein